jgi:anti-sigma B factor antagonist
VDQLEEILFQELIVIRLVAARLDRASAPLLKNCLLKHIKNGQQRLIIDLSEVDFVDSYGLNVLVLAVKRLDTHGQLAISGPRNTVMGMLKLTRLYQVFNIFPDCARAIDAVRTSAGKSAVSSDRSPATIG